MPEYLSPGVYVEEVDAGPKPIEGVSTSTAGAVGVTARGPTDGKPVLVTSYADFVRKFGGTPDVPETARVPWRAPADRGEFWTFPLAVRGFFDNGGQRLYVRRVLPKAATASNLECKAGLIALIDSDELATSTSVTLSHLVGITKDLAPLDLWIEGQKVTRKVVAFDSRTRRVTLDNALGARTRRGRDYAVVKAGANAAPKLKVEAKAKGGWGDDLRVAFAPQEAAALNLLAWDDPANKVLETKVKAAVSPAAPDLVIVDSSGTIKAGDWVAVDDVLFKVTAATQDAGGDKLTLDASREWKKDARVRRVRWANKDNKTLYGWGIGALYDNALVEIDAGTDKHFARITALDPIKKEVVIDPPMPNTLPRPIEGHKLRLIELEARIAYAPTDPEGARAETISNIRITVPASGTPDPAHISQRLGALSGLVQLVGPTPLAGLSITTLDAFPCAHDPAVPPAGMAPGWAALSQGDDKLGDLAPDDFIGEDKGPERRSGILALEDIDEVSICVVPGIWSSVVQSALIQHCEGLKDRFAILDPVPLLAADPDPIEKIRAFREGFDTKYAALYFPRIAVRDPASASTVLLGPSGHMAGVYARVDIERGVHKAPANEVIRGIDLANGKHGLEAELAKREQDMLNPKGINALRFFPNRGTRVWGARTLSSDGSWKYVNVRRIFIFVEESIDEGTQWVVFEPNDEKTWARVRQSITNFLTTQWRAGMLQGTKAEEAFFVRCDRTTMTQDDIDNGRLICVIGIAPVKPAEFVIFRIQQKTLDKQAP